ncbi:hypothetical protein E2C01_064375 [Portunus trituberculatus]|uniref:Uncharacterized protein n=1 Tax=Portunus trituberculatus TaxID=210409 RepID=A0A5B7HJK8_PORTR|nr:hypothetical protein [Portunus trituberculatus]
MSVTYKAVQVIDGRIGYQVQEDRCCVLPAPQRTTPPASCGRSPPAADPDSSQTALRGTREP